MGKEKKRSKEEIERQFPVMKEMYESGYTVVEIADYFCLSQSSIHNTFNMMGYSVKGRSAELDESKLMYADNKPPVLEKMIIGGKRYVDYTPVYAPR